MTTQPVLRFAGRVKPVFGIFLAFLLFGFNFNSFAIINTHNWQESHRGYSIELVPGTAGSNAEYVAAGTVYDVSKPNESGWHYMHLDANGNILNSRIAWAQAPLHEFRVVDIAVQNANAFRITIQARITIASLARDYVYVHGVDINGTDLPPTSNPDIAIFCDGEVMHNIYPTHSYYAGSSLYICGYGTLEDTQYPLEPNKNSGSKNGMIMKIDVNATPVTHTENFWNSAAYFNQAGTDYDMALKLSPYSLNNPFPLLMTGAMNYTYDGCFAFIGKVDNAGTITSMTGIESTYFTPQPSEQGGIYAIDARAQIAGVDEDGDIELLVNSFDDSQPHPAYTRNWGCIRIHNNLTTYPTSVNSCLFAPHEQGWANQFLNLHMTGVNPVGDHIDVVGQQYDKYTPGCVNLPVGALNPAMTNINPFIAEVGVGNTWFNVLAYNGYLGSGPIQYHYFYPSTKGTKAVNMDYLPGSVSYFSPLEDVTRLYTFTCLERYYDATANQSVPAPAMVLPIGEYPMVTNNNLLTKFLGLNSGYEEPTCNTHTNDCIKTNILAGSNAIGAFEDPAPLQTCNEYPAYTIFTLDNNPDIPTTTDCSGGYYKPSGVQSHYLTGDGLKIYPNPATTELYVQFSQGMSGKKFQFTLMDMTGKNVFNSNGHVTGEATKIMLPNLAAGMYMSTVLTEGKKEMKKITIQ